MTDRIAFLALTIYHFLKCLNECGDEVLSQGGRESSMQCDLL